MSTAFRVMMTSGQEVPPNGTNAKGLGTVIFDSTNVTATYELTIGGVDFGTILGQPAQTANPADDVTAMHVHNGAFGANGPVVFGQRGPAQDVDDFSGIINLNGSTTIKGIWETTDAASTSINAFAGVLGAAPLGAMVNLYWNVHTSAFPGGQIRGQWECIATDNGELVSGTGFADILPGLGGDDQVKGGKGNDRITGDLGDDMLSGGKGDDELSGGAGKDQLRGDAGEDTLTGGASKDKFVFFAVSDSLAASPDTVTDFSAATGDRMDLHNIDAVVGGGDNAFTFVGSFTNVAGQAVLTYSLGFDITTLECDVNGDGASDFTVIMDGNINSSSGWIL